MIQKYNIYVCVCMCVSSECMYSVQCKYMYTCTNTLTHIYINTYYVVVTVQFIIVHLIVNYPLTITIE